MADFSSDTVSPEQFEGSVRQIARQLFQAPGTGAIHLDGRERDEVIDTGTELIIIEATGSRKQSKAEYDLEKSRDLVRSLKATNQFSEYNFRIILVTASEPTADQNKIVSSAKVGCPKEIISFATLFSRLFDARAYLRLRGSVSFGSIRNPADDNDLDVPPSSYIPTALNESSTGRDRSAAQLAEYAQSGGRYILFGDYGSGKSMTMRDIYFRMRDEFGLGKSTLCPVYLNLREHIAQTQPDEALFRHAEKIGFRDQYSLIAAWRAGYIALFLDGFDELTPPQFSVPVKSLRQARRFAVELVSNFLNATPKSAPIFIAGRQNYFDSADEARSALGYSTESKVLTLAGFDDDQIARYLKSSKTKLPNWLPSRPLLLGYLANSKILEEGEQLTSLSATAGWNQLLDRVCEREVRQIWGVGFDASDLRLFIEGLASRARRYLDLSRGLQDSDLQAVFSQVFGRDADTPANLLASRLPGLGAVPGRASTREFVDTDFFDAAASGDLKRFIESPFAESPALNDIKRSIGPLGSAMAAEFVDNLQSKLSVAIAQAARRATLAVTAADLITIVMERQESYNGEAVVIEKASFDSIVIDAAIDISNITFKECIFSTVELGRGSISEERNNLPQFIDCAIDKMEGVMGPDDLPKGVLAGSSTVEHYVGFAATNDAVMESALSAPVKVLLTILRKLFLQKGSGRQYGALRRGIPPNTARFVDPIVSLIKSSGFAEAVSLDRRLIIVPNRRRSGEALSIINAPNASTHSLLKEVRALS